jgi:transglutaminase-like putative cysteine protease
MRLHITHTTRYVYSQPVFIEPTTLCLRPRSDVAQHLHAFDLHIDPQPAGANDTIDLDGNNTDQVWFSSTHDHLTITARSEVETLATNAFNFVLPQTATSLPVKYDTALSTALAPYCQRAAATSDVDALARELTALTGGATLAFLTELTALLNQRITMDVRENGEPHHPAHTLATGRGACRDVALLFMDVCRAAAFAARFVSGYKAYDLSGEQHLHAWAEIYLPGAGWRGFDPSEGLAVADRHVALAAAAHPLTCAPITGPFRGTGASATMNYELAIDSI